MRSTLLSFGAALLLAACGSPGEVKGTVDGRELVVRDAVFTKADGRWPRVILSDVEDLCSVVQGNAVASEDARFLVMTLSRFDGEEPVEVVPGGYTVYDVLDESSAPDARASAFFDAAGQFGFTSTSTSRHFAREGTVQLRRFSPENEIAGDFELKVGPGLESLKGSFSAPFCFTL